MMITLSIIMMMMTRRKTSFSASLPSSKIYHIYYSIYDDNDSDDDDNDSDHTDNEGKDSQTPNNSTL